MVFPSCPDSKGGSVTQAFLERSFHSPGCGHWCRSWGANQMEPVGPVRLCRGCTETGSRPLAALHPGRTALNLLIAILVQHKA